VVVNDCSTDGTWEKIDGIPRARGYHTATGFAAGVCAARNLGVSQAANALIVPLDADDWLIDGGLQVLYDAYHPGTLVYAGWYEMRGTKYTYQSPGHRNAIRRKNLCQGTYLFHADDWERVGGYDPDFNLCAEDWAFMVSLMRAGVKLTRVDKAVYAYTISNNGRAGRCPKRYPFVRQLLEEKYYA